MTRNQLANSAFKSFSANPMFTVDPSGNITPTDPQTVLPNGTILIHAASAPSPAPAPYGGYVCAWRDGQCQCALLVTDLGTEKHMKIRSTPYTVAANAPEGDFTIYATLSEDGSGPTANATNGDLHVGH